METPVYSNISSTLSVLTPADTHAGGREVLEYLTSLLRAQNDEHADQLLPALQPSQLKHLAFMADALFYWLRIAYAGRASDGWKVLSESSGALINESDQLHPSAHAVLNALISEETASGIGSSATLAEDADPDGFSGLRRWHLFQEDGLSLERLPLDFRNRLRRYNRNALLHIGRLSLPAVPPGALLAGTTPAPTAAASGAASGARDSSGNARERMRALQERQRALEQEVRELVAQETAFAARESLARAQPFSGGDPADLERQQHTLLESLLAVSTPPPPATDVSSESRRLAPANDLQSARHLWSSGLMGSATSDHLQQMRTTESIASSPLTALPLSSSQPIVSMFLTFFYFKYVVVYSKSIQSCTI